MDEGLFRELLDFLCDGWDEMSDTLLNWIGCGLFHPAQRLRWSILPGLVGLC